LGLGVKKVDWTSTFDFVVTLYPHRSPDGPLVVKLPLSDQEVFKGIPQTPILNSRPQPQTLDPYPKSWTPTRNPRPKP